MAEPTASDNTLPAARQAGSEPFHPGTLLNDLGRSLHSRDRSLLLSAGILLLGAMFTRVACIGDPALHMDEEFYLLVADRIWQGALPYVDIWDRKPIGLFLIYALLRPLSSNGIVAYQVGAFLSAYMTSLVIWRICMRFFNNHGAVLGGLTYLFFLPLVGGMGGQAPVTLAALLILRAQEAESRKALHLRSYAAMALCGLAIQIKYSVVFEGIIFGLWLLQQKLRESGSIVALFYFGFALITIALVPTIVAASTYAAAGRFNEFYDANFLSIMRVTLPPPTMRLNLLTATTYLIFPLLLMGLAAIPTLVRSPLKARNLFLLTWTTAAVVGFFAVGNNYPHYALPLLVPLSILSATLFHRMGIGLLIGGVWHIILFAIPISGVQAIRHHRIDAMVTSLRPYAQRGCIYVNDGPPILYLLTSTCLPTPYVFPEHLNNAGENDAVDAPLKMARLLKALPAAIMVADKILDHPRNQNTAAMLNQAISKHYHEVARLPDVFAGRHQILYARNDLK